MHRCLNVGCVKVLQLWYNVLQNPILLNLGFCDLRLEEVFLGSRLPFLGSIAVKVPRLRVSGFRVSGALKKGSEGKIGKKESSF